MKTWVLMDFSYLAYRAMYTMQGLEHSDQPTGVIYGFFEAIRHICFDARIQSNRIAIFEDSSASYRREAFPGYKFKRRTKERTPEEEAFRSQMFEQMDLMKSSMFPDVGIPRYKQMGLESDDLIAMAAQQLDPADQAFIITADQDLFQCIWPGVRWFDPSRNLMVDREGLKALKNCYPCEWATVKAIAGCSSDEVAGVMGIGEKTAVNFVRGTLPTTHKRYRDIVSTKGQRVIERNRPLVTLPHTKTKRFDLIEPSYNPDNFYKWAEKLGFRSYLDARKGTWDNFFAGKVQTVDARTPTRRPGETRKRVEGLL